jgi:hypothetical protein
MASLVRIPANLGAMPTAHVALQLVDGRRLRPEDDVQRNGLVRLAAKASHLERGTRHSTHAQSRRGLRWTLEGEHPFVPGVAGEAIGSLARRRSALSRRPNGRVATAVPSRRQDHRKRRKHAAADLGLPSHNIEARAPLLLLRFPSRWFDGNRR